MNSLQQFDNSLIDLDREAIESLVKSQFDGIESGEVDPIKAFVFSHKLLEFAKQLQESLKTHISGLQGEYNGLRISDVKTGSKFNYNNCGDIKYNKLVESFNDLKNAISEREAFLKTIKQPLTEVDTETGETFEIKPPVNTFSISTKVEWLPKNTK